MDTPTTRRTSSGTEDTRTSMVPGLRSRQSLERSVGLTGGVTTVLGVDSGKNHPLVAYPAAEATWSSTSREDNPENVKKLFC